MKILYIDITDTGHHKYYHDYLVNYFEKNNIVMSIFPPNFLKENIERYSIDLNKKEKNKYKIITYIKWMREIFKLIKKEKPDIVHFLYGDLLYRYFGMFLRKIKKKCHTIVTLHHIRKGKIKNISIKHICNSVNDIVVHTKSLKKDLYELGINNVTHIEYPVFKNKNNGILLSNNGINIKVPKDRKILLAIGETRHDKGLDILLEALKQVEKNFYLIIAGKEGYFTQQYILKMIEEYKDNVTVYFKYLTEIEMEELIKISDYIILPYRRIFDGASGMLAEAIYYNKKVIGPSHGSLGDIINKNNLGLTFECEDVKSLAETISHALTINTIFSDKYKNYKENLNVELFLKRYENIYKNFNGLKDNK